MANRPLPKNIQDGTEEKKKLQQDLDFLNDNLWISGSAPTAPRFQFWFEPTTKVLKFWDGTAWKTVTLS